MEYPNLKVERINIQESDEAYKRAKELGATATPTLFILKDGNAVEKMEGDVPEKSIRSYLQKLVNDLS